jgi:internalin A
MQEFELCYAIPNKRHQYIVPDLLPVKEPENLETDTYPLHFRIVYTDLLPRSVMPRLIVQMHHRIKKAANSQWRTGVILYEPHFKAQALVKADYSDRFIDIWVKGEERRRMLSYIRETISNINADFTMVRTKLCCFSPKIEHYSFNSVFFFHFEWYL